MLCNFNPYRGLGSFSSENGVHTESGVFCSLNRPKNTFSMSAIEKAQTADPGILWREKHIIESSIFDFSISYFWLIQQLTADMTHLFICVVNTPTTEGTPLM